MMILILCSGTADSPCGKVLGCHLWDKSHKIFYDRCKLCRLTKLKNDGTATQMELVELEKLLAQSEENEALI